ncbi:MAG: hypothetical protein HQM06_03910 [Magnetococcales bacterium]|nr:hypothetical protein [Magnetococcales bacterium]
MSETIAINGVDQADNFTALIQQADGWWIGWIEEMPGVNCQEATRAALLETLAVTLNEALVHCRTTVQRTYSPTPGTIS